jgi:hypothetical protein
MEKVSENEAEGQLSTNSRTTKEKLWQPSGDRTL